jgi:hypothetical protein
MGMPGRFQRGTVPPSQSTGQLRRVTCIKRGVSATAQHEKREARKDEVEVALQKVLAGHSFRSSAQCQALLRYIVERSLSQENEMLRERVIGINVFGRPTNYDSGNDPIVRARAAEVRKRLAQHYLHGDGADEEIRIEIPSGSYRAIFETRGDVEIAGTSRNVEVEQPSPVPPTSRAEEVLPDPVESIGGAVHFASSRGLAGQTIDERRMLPRRAMQPSMVLAAVAALIGLAGAFAGYLATVHWIVPRDRGAQPSSSASDDTVAAFWTPFLKQDRSPIIAYADAMFLIDGSGDLFRFRHGAADNRGVEVDSHLALQFAANPRLVAGAGPLFYDNGYTGTGDLRAMAMLITQLAHMGATPIIKSSYDISTDDLNQHNVILLGSSAEDTAVAQLVPTGDFLFAGPVSSRDPWSDQIVNGHPAAGERPTYTTLRDAATHVLQADYALVSFQPGITTDHQIAILGGIDTTGTEGAALLVTSKAGVEELSNALSQARTVPQTGRNRSFQALVRVDVKKGYQVLDTHLVTVHPLASRPNSGIDTTSP